MAQFFELKITQHIVRLISLVLLAHIFLSWRLWAAGPARTFPLVPLWGMPFQLPDVWAAWQAWFLVLLAALTVLFPANKGLLAILVGWVLCLVAQDLNRLQPWLYFYTLCWGILLSGTARSKASTLAALRLTVAAVYVWGGLNKLTPYFAVDNFPWFCEAFTWTKPLGAFPVAGYAVAVAEFLFGVGLLWRQSRRLFRWLVVAFHLFILAALSPLGLHWNTIVIPWNLAMAAMVWLLFEAREMSAVWLMGKKTGKNRLVFGTILALAWCMPALNILHCWDEPLSWKMYSNTQTEASFQGVPCPGATAIWQRYAFDDGRKLLLDDWSMEELHVPVYNDRGVFRRIAHYLCQCADQPDSAGLYLLTVQRWNRSAESWEIIPCNQLAR